MSAILTIGGVSTAELAKTFQTPLYVYDQGKIESMATLFKESFVSHRFPTKILYASKAFQAVELLNLLADHGFGLDVVSGGELFAALKSRIDPSEIYFHGNNKSQDELNFAFLSGIRHIVVDNLMEMQAISRLAKTYKQQMFLSFRLNVGVEAHTHEYIVTSHVDSKFGMAYGSDDFRGCLEEITQNPFLTLEGFHSHIGSQIFDTRAWHKSIDILTGYLKDFPDPLTLNIGGGFGITYTKEDTPLPMDKTLRSLIAHVEAALDREGVAISRLIIEPGRSIVGEAGSTLYTVGYQKETPGKKYFFVDGGMGDNMRPSLYQAKYRCDLANRMDEPKTVRAAIAGKYCESGDILIKDALLPPAKMGDLLVVYGTGAYGYSMSSQYNRNTIPGVVFCNNGEAREIVRRQSFEDLIRNEIFERTSPPHLEPLHLEALEAGEG